MRLQKDLPIRKVRIDILPRKGSARVALIKDLPCGKTELFHGGSRAWNQDG